MAVVRKWTFLLVLTVAFANVVACSKQTSPTDQGTQVGGGGVTPKSTVDQVNAALDQALQLASEQGVTKNIFVQFWSDKGSKSKTSSISEPVHVFPAYAEAATPDKQFDNKFALALTQNRITRRAQGDCPHPSYELDADASVSQLNYQADICFSIGNLTATAPSDLLKQVLALVLHEATHMGGADEAEARAWQTEFIDYFGTRIGDISENIKDTTLAGITKAHLYVASAQDHFNQDSADQRIAGDLAAMSAVLEHLPYWNDPIAIKLKLNPPHPELIEKYTDVVASTVNDVRMHFEGYHGGWKLESWHPVDMPGLSSAALAAANQEAITRYNKAIDHIYDMFLSVTELNYTSTTSDPPTNHGIKVFKTISIPVYTDWNFLPKKDN